MIITKIIQNFGKKKKQVEPFDVFTMLSDLTSSLGTVFDVGAHHGNFIQKVINLNVDSEIHAFEPFIDSYNVLTERWGKLDCLKLNNIAVSNFVGTADFYGNVGDETNSLMEAVATGDHSVDYLTRTIAKINVPVTTLDHYAMKNQVTSIDFLKVDAQGSSFEVLEGAKMLLHKRAIRRIYAEIEFVEIYKDEKRFSEIEIFLRSFGYQFVRFYNINYNEKGAIAWADALFIVK